jgi:hypothetical protein
MMKEVTAYSELMSLWLSRIFRDTTGYNKKGRKCWLLSYVVETEHMTVTQHKINCGYGRRNELIILQWH